jgi:hypothetical protein
MFTQYYLRSLKIAVFAGESNATLQRFTSLNAGCQAKSPDHGPKKIWSDDCMAILSIGDYQFAV